MSGHALAWLVAAAAALGSALGVFFAMTPWRSLRWLAALQVVVVALLPWRFQDDPERFAPAFIVVAFRWLFEAGADPGPPARALLVAAAAALVLFLAGLALAGLVQAGRARRRSMR